MATCLKRDYTLLSKHRKGREQRGSPVPSSLPSRKPTLQINTQCRDQGTAGPANSSGSDCPLTSHLCHLLNSQSPAQRWVASTPLHKSMISLKRCLLTLSVSCLFHGPASEGHGCDSMILLGVRGHIPGWAHFQTFTFTPATGMQPKCFVGHWRV